MSSIDPAIWGCNGLSRPATNIPWLWGILGFWIKAFFVRQITGSILATSVCFIRNTTKNVVRLRRCQLSFVGGRFNCQPAEVRKSATFCGIPQQFHLWAVRIIFSGAREIHYKPISATAEERREEAEEEGGMDGLVGEWTEARGHLLVSFRSAILFHPLNRSIILWKWKSIVSHNGTLQNEHREV